MSTVALNDTVEVAVAKKVQLLDQDLPRFAVRAVLAGIYLTIATAFAGVAAHIVNQVAPGLGYLVFSVLFGIGLFAIVTLNAELATSGMMYSSYAVTTGQIRWSKALKLVLVTTAFNLAGAILVALLLSQSAKFGHMTDQDFMSQVVQSKLSKPATGIFLEAIGANFVVNMAVIAASYCKDYLSKLVAMVLILAMFVGMGLEHVIANFSLMNLVFFAADPLPAALEPTAVLINWVCAWLGNFIGGGLLMGATYAWLNKTDLAYRD